MTFNVQMHSALLQHIVMLTLLAIPWGLCVSRIASSCDPDQTLERFGDHDRNCQGP